MFNVYEISYFSLLKAMYSYFTHNFILYKYLHSIFVCRLVNHVEFHPSGTCIAAGGTDNTVKVNREMDCLRKILSSTT